MTKFQYDMYNLIYDGMIVSQHGVSTRSMISTHFEMAKA